MHVIYYWQRGNLKATRLSFFRFIISQHIVQILLNWSDILFLSTLSQKVFLLFPLVCWMCRCKLGAAFTWPSKARVNCWSTWFILKTNRHRGQLSSAADVMGIPVAQGLWDLSFDKSPFFMSQTCASSPPEISDHKKLQKLLSNLLLVYSVLLKFHYGRETIPFVISLYNNMFWDGNLWMLKSFILNDISPCVC